jgi:broad specificity phosphatase PhoE
MELIIVRHGETESNLAGLLQGQQDGVLSEKGRLQAKAVAEMLRNEHFSHLFSSDLMRAKETCRNIASGHPHLKIVESPSLRERALGEWEGRAGQEYFKALLESGESRIHFTPHGGESIQALQRRTDLFLERLCTLPSESSILICTHGGVITTMLATLLDATLEEMLAHRFLNTSVTRMSMVGREVMLRNFNCVEHLR